MTLSTMQTGFLGLGTMGGRMAARLLDLAHQVTVYDPSATAMQALVKAGATAAAGPREVAQASDIIATSLPSGPVFLDAMRQVIQGGRTRLVVDFSTIGPAAANEASKLLSDAGIALVDAPVSGSPSASRDGTLTLMVSGLPDAVEQARPILEAIGKRIVVLGDTPGLGQSMKLVNNFLSAAALAASAEAVVMGAKAGLDPVRMMEVLNAGSGKNSATLDKIPNDVIPRRFAHGFATGLLFKDISLYLQEANGLGVPTKVGEAVVDLWAQSKMQIGADADCTRIFEFIEAEAGVKIESSYPTI